MVKLLACILEVSYLRIFSMTRTWKGKIAVDSLLPGCCYYKKKFAYVSAS